MSEPSDGPRCPVCGSRPESVDYVDIPGPGFVERVAGTYHCPNEHNAEHLAAHAESASLPRPSTPENP